MRFFQKREFVIKYSVSRKLFCSLCLPLACWTFSHQPLGTYSMPCCSVKTPHNLCTHCNMTCYVHVHTVKWHFMQRIVCKVRKHAHGKMLAGTGKKKQGAKWCYVLYQLRLRPPGPFNNSGWLLEEQLWWPWELDPQTLAKQCFHLEFFDIPRVAIIL